MRKQNYVWPTAWLLIALALAAWLLPQIAAAGTNTINNLNDSGAGSLRDTIAAAAAGDSIEFSVNGTITLTGGELLIARDLTIIGPAGRVTVSGNGASRVFKISPNITVNIANLTIASGQVVGGAGPFGDEAAGGGIYNLGTVNLVNCTLQYNRAIGRNNHGDVDAGSGSGGGIWNQGTLNLTNSTLHQNLALGGDSDNGAGGSGTGGGVFSRGTVIMVNCTFSENIASGGSSIPLGNAGIGTGGGLFQGGNTSIRNSVIAGNSAFSPGAFFGAPDVDGFNGSQGHNLIGDTYGSGGWTGTDLTDLNQMLGPFQDNGGPTLTKLPLFGSPVIDAGDDSITDTLATDQRGMPRRIGAHVDIGACEVGPGEAVNPLLVFNNNDSGTGSLRQAILDAPVYNLHTITFDPNVVGTITLTSGELVIGKDLVINGPGANVLTINGNNASRVFHITGGASQISNLRIANGHAAAGGGGIAMDGGSLTVSNCALTGCYAQGVDVASQGGGGIAVVGTANLAIINSTLSSNTTPYDGGGLYLFNAPTVSLINCTVSGNRTLDGGLGDGGGGIFVGNSSKLNVTNSTIANNSSVSQGGGVYKGLSGTVTLRNSLIAGNSAAGLGPDCKGTFVSAGYNLIGNTGGSTGLGSTGDQLNVNPLIGPLQDNGGPTFTHALLAGSPAIDKGNSGLTADQRGAVRPLDTAIANATDGDGGDIGAVEAGSFLRITDLRTSGPQVNISFTTDPGWPYSLESKDALAPGPWTLVPGSARTGNGTALTVPDTRPRVPKRFYRAVMAAPTWQVVYVNNFEGAVGAEWSVQAVSTTPVGGRKFLGEFASTVATLQLANLPAHTRLRVSFDLFILKSWDGNRTDFGPDTFQLSVHGGSTLIGSTFSTYTTQSYPGALTDSFPANTGAVEINTLGYTHSNLGPADAVYRLTAAFNHTAPGVTLDFSGVNLQEIGDESWGLDNVRVEVSDIP